MIYTNIIWESKDKRETALENKQLMTQVGCLFSNAVSLLSLLSQMMFVYIILLIDVNNMSCFMKT